MATVFLKMVRVKEQLSFQRIVLTVLRKKPQLEQAPVCDTFPVERLILPLDCNFLMIPASNAVSPPEKESKWINNEAKNHDRWLRWRH